MSIPPIFNGYPALAQHFIRIDMVHCGRPGVSQWDNEAFVTNHIDISTADRLKRWRAYSLGVAPKKFKANYLVGEQTNLKVFSSVCTRSYKSPIQGTVITEPELTEHFKKSNASWFETTLGDNRIFVSELDDDFLDYAMRSYDNSDLNALDEIGEANLDNAMEG